MANLHWYRELGILQVSRADDSDDLLEICEAESGRVVADLPAGAGCTFVGAGALVPPQLEGAWLGLVRVTDSSHVTLDADLVPLARITRGAEGFVLEGEWGKYTQLELQLVAWGEREPRILRWKVGRGAESSFAVSLDARGVEETWQELHVAVCVGERQGPSFGAWVEPVVGRSGHGAGDAREHGLRVALGERLEALREDAGTRGLVDLLPAAAAWAFAGTEGLGEDVPRALEAWLARPHEFLGRAHHARFSGLMAGLADEVARGVWTARALVMASAAARGREDLTRWFGEASVAEVLPGLVAMEQAEGLSALTVSDGGDPAHANADSGSNASSGSNAKAAGSETGGAPGEPFTGDAWVDPLALERSGNQGALGAGLRWLEELGVGPGVPAWPEEAAEDHAIGGGPARRASFAWAAVRELVEGSMEPGEGAWHVLSGEPAIAEAAARLREGVDRVRGAIGAAVGEPGELDALVGPLGDACEALENGLAAVAVRRNPGAARDRMAAQAREWRELGRAAGDGFSRNVEESLGALEAFLGADDSVSVFRSMELVEQVCGLLQREDAARAVAAATRGAELDQCTAGLPDWERDAVRGPLRELMGRAAWPGLAGACPVAELVAVLVARAEALGRDRTPGFRDLAWLIVDIPAVGRWGAREAQLASEAARVEGLLGGLERLAGDGKARHAALGRVRTLRAQLGSGGAAGLRLLLVRELMLRLERLSRRMGDELGSLPPVPPRRAGEEAALVGWLSEAHGATGAADGWHLGSSQRGSLLGLLRECELAPGRGGA